MLRGRRDRYHRIGLLIPLTVGAVAIPLQIVMGDFIARYVFQSEPAKFAAIEALPHTAHARARDARRRPDRRQGALRHPDPGRRVAAVRASARRTRVPGLDAIPTAVRPPDELVSIVHLSFDVMVGTGVRAGSALALWFALSWWRSRAREPNRWFLRAVAISGLVAIVSLECGWIITEVGRQPWTVVGLLLTRDAVQTSGNLWPLFAGAVVIYVGVTVGAVYALRALRRRWAAGRDRSTRRTARTTNPTPAWTS